MGEILIDKVALSAGIAGDFDYDNEGEHFIHQFIREGKGCILIGGHIGSWDIAAFFLHIRTKVNVVMYQNEKAQIQAVLDQAKGTNQVNIIPMSNDMSYLIEVKNALDRNEVVCFNADRFIRGDKTMTFHFLGEKAHFPTGVYQIAAKLKSPIACIAGVKKSKRKYQFYCEPIPYKPLTRNKQEDNAIFHGMVKQYVLFFERITRQYPLQWFNHFNFWKANKLRTT